MAVGKCVLVYGKCLNLAGVAACLKLDAGLDVHLADSDQCSAREVLDAFKPETIIYDLSDPPTDLDLALLSDRPGTQLIGVDPSSDEVLVMTGQRNRIVNASELAQLVSAKGSQPSTRDKDIGANEGGEYGTSS